jgi:hypothetical protein
MTISVRRLEGNPIISRETSATTGVNINGPSLVIAPPWLANPLGRYYLYFAHHRGQFIRLATADHLEGPWAARPTHRCASYEIQPSSASMSGPSCCIRSLASRGSPSRSSPWPTLDDPAEASAQEPRRSGRRPLHPCLTQSPAYSSSISSAYRSYTTHRFTFIVGLSSPAPAVRSCGSIRNFRMPSA